MTLRFRKSLRFSRYFRINISRRGIGWGASIPQLGIRYTASPAPGRKTPPSNPTPESPAPAPAQAWAKARAQALVEAHIPRQARMVRLLWRTFKAVLFLASIPGWGLIVLSIKVLFVLLALGMGIGYMTGGFARPTPAATPQTTG